MRRHALLIGIDRYPLLPAAKQLGGCGRDVELLAAVLRSRWGFRRRDMVILTDRSATREGLRHALAELLLRVAAGDCVLVHFSGHGSQVPDEDGDEEDRWDETIVPHDSGRDGHPNRDLVDDHIHGWLVELAKRTGNITLTFDSCYSGTILRQGRGAVNARFVPRDERRLRRTRGDGVPGAPPVAIRSAERTSGGWFPPSFRYLLLSGCKEGESTYELRGQHGFSRPCGVFSHFLTHHLARAEEGCTYRELWQRVATRVRQEFPRQHPQLVGDGERRLFEAGEG